MNADIVKAVGHLLKVKRRVNEITQAELATRVGITIHEVKQYENGYAIPSSVILDKLIIELDIQPKQLDLFLVEYDQRLTFLKSANDFCTKRDYVGLRILLQKEENQLFLQDADMQKSVLRFKGLCILFLDKNYYEAIRIFEQALKLPSATQEDDIDDYELHNCLGLCRYELKSFNEAITYFLKAKESAEVLPDFSKSNFFIKIHYNISLGYRKLNKIDEAFKSVMQAIEANISRSSIYFMDYLFYQKANVLNHMEDIEACEEALSIAVIFSNVVQSNALVSWEQALQKELQLKKIGIWEHRGRSLVDCSSSEIEEIYNYYEEIPRFRKKLLDLQL